VRKVTEDINALRFNTAIAQMMIFVNEATRLSERPREIMEGFVLLLSPFAPHVCEELWQLLGRGNSLSYEPWPSFDPAKAAEQEIEIVFQVNGKVRSKGRFPADTEERVLEQRAMEDPNVLRHIDGKTVVKKIVVKNKLVNLVIAAT